MIYAFWSFPAFKVTISFTKSLTKFIFLVEKLVKLTKELSTIIDLINHKYWDRMHDGVSGLVEKYFFQLQKISR